MAEPIIVSGGKKSDNRRVKIMAGVGGAIFVLLVVVPKLLGGGGGGGGDVTEFPPVASPPKASAPGAAVPETFEGFTSKNPFKPLVAMASASGGGDVTVDTGGTPVVAPGDFVDTPATIPGEDGQPVGVPTEQGPTPTTVPPRQPDRVGLLEVYTDQGGQPVASVRVNDTTYQVVRGDRFAGSYQVISIDVASRCGDFLFGDDRFRLCEGDEVRK
jgi:hypothetical protein